MFDEEKSGSVSSELTQCALGTYYILFSSSPLSQVGVHLKGTTLTDAVPIEDKDKSTNHIVHRTYTNSRGTAWRDEIIYYDEMGREQERVKKKASPDLQNDLVDLAEYDSFGRLDKQWLTTAVPGNNGAFVPPTSLCPLSSASNLGDAPDGSLNVTRITDEDGNISYVFKYDNGLTVLSRQVLQEQLVDTYNIYDEWGHLRMVLPPLAAVGVTYI